MSTSASTFVPPLRSELVETAADRRWDEVVGELGEVAGQIISQFLGWQLGLSPGRARELAKISARRSELPEVTALLDQGLLSADQVGPIATRLPADPGADHHFAELAPNLTVTQIRKALQATVPPDEMPPVGDDDDSESPPSSPRELSFGHDDDGTWGLHLRAGTADGGLFEAALRSPGRADRDPAGDCSGSCSSRGHRYRFLRFGAACDSAEPAAVFEARLVRPSRKTLLAAFAARGPVRRFRAILGSFPGLRRRLLHPRSWASRGWDGPFFANDSRC